MIRRMERALTEQRPTGHLQFSVLVIFHTVEDSGEQRGSGQRSCQEEARGIGLEDRPIVADQILAQEIAAESDLEVKRRSLQAIIAKEPGALATLRKGSELSAPQPNDMNAWVSAAEKDGLNVQIAQANADLAARDAAAIRATVDEAAALGAEGLDLAIIYLPPPYDPAVLEPLAEAIRGN